MEQDPASAQWFGGVIIQSEDNTIVGCAGFLGPPNDDGFVKIGFGVVPEYQGNGFATEIAAELIQWAMNKPDVTRVTGSCLKQNAASKRVLEKVGMKQRTESDDMIY